MRIMRIIRIYSSHTVTNFVIRYIRKIRMTIKKVNVVNFQFSILNFQLGFASSTLLRIPLS